MVTDGVFLAGAPRPVDLGHPADAERVLEQWRSGMPRP